MADLLIGIEVEPALAAVVLRTAVPGDRQGLQAAVRERDQVLLQRIDAEGVFHLERGELAIGPVRLDEEPAVLAEKAGWHAVVLKARIVEVAQHRLFGGMLHRALVLRGAPQLRLGAVAAGARLAAHEGSRRGGVRASAAGPGVGSVTGQSVKRQPPSEHDHRRGRGCKPELGCRPSGRGCGVRRAHGRHLPRSAARGRFASVTRHCHRSWRETSPGCALASRTRRCASSRSSC